MLHPSTKKLIDRLAVMTAQKKIDWIEKDNGDVLYATEGYVVRLTPEPPRVLLSTDGGKPLEDASANVLAATAREDGGTYGDLVTTLARDACRDARGTEQAISTLLAGLSDSPAEAETPAEADAPVEKTAEAEEPAEAEADAAAAETADVYEEVTPDAVDETGEDLVEDPVDETAALSAAAPDPAEADFASSWSTSGNDNAETAPAIGVTDDDDLVDASVPEAAIVEEAETDDEATAFSSEADVSEDDADADEEPEDETPTVATLAGEDDVDSENEVSGAVARLAEQVNATPVDPIAASHTETSDVEEEPEEPTTGMGADDAAATEFADHSEETTEETFASEAEPTVETANENDEKETDADDETLAAFSPTPSFSVQPDDAPAFGDDADETAPEAAAPVAEDDDVAEDDEVTAEATDETSDDVTPVAPVWDAAPSENSAVVEDAEEVSETEEPAIAVADETPSNVHYVPFGAGGIEAAGADVTEEELAEQPQDDETDSSLATAATMMNAPDPAPEIAESDAPAETEPTLEAPDETLNAAEASEPVSAPVEAAEEPYRGPPGPISLSGMGAGHGFGRTATGFQPTPPSPSAPSQTGESVTRGPVFIDATEDFTGETEAAAARANVPDVTDLSDREDYVEASVSDADLDAVAPQDQAQPTAEPAGAATSLSLVDNDNSSSDNAPEEDTQRPVRPKTRFNPWT